MAIVLGRRKYGRYTAVCQLRLPGDAAEHCRYLDRGMRPGRRWARCTGVRSNLRRPAPVEPVSFLPLVAPPLVPRPRRPTTVSLQALRRFLGDPDWKQWVKLLERAGVPRRRANGKRSKLSHAECRQVLETRYRELGARKLARRGARGG